MVVPTVFDFNVTDWSKSTYYVENAKHMSWAYDASSLGAPAGTWSQFQPMLLTYTVTVTDQNSGIFTMNDGSVIKYSNFNGTTCTFDMSEIAPGLGSYSATLATEKITIIGL